MNYKIIYIVMDTIKSKLYVIAGVLGLAGFSVGYIKGALETFNDRRMCNNREKLLVAPVTSIFDGLFSGMTFIMYPWVPVMLLFRLFGFGEKYKFLIAPYYLEWKM
jgi:hypothetical protein